MVLKPSHLLLHIAAASCLASQWSLVAADDDLPPCRPRDPKGNDIKDSFGRPYDLSPLRRLSGQNEWIALDKVGGNTFTYTINVCEHIYSNSEAKAKNAAVWQSSKDGVRAPANLGLPSTDVKLVEDGILSLTYENGDSCNEGNLRKSSVITFYCDPKKPKDHPPILAREEKGCTYVFQWETPHACGIGMFSKGKKLGGGAIFFIILLLGIVFYLVGGAAYNRFVKGERGLDQLPNLDFWLVFPQRCKEWFTSCKSNLMEALRRGGAARRAGRLGGAEYRGVPQNDEHGMRGSQDSLIGSDHEDFGDVDDGSDDERLLDA